MFNKNGPVIVMHRTEGYLVETNRFNWYGDGVHCNGYRIDGKGGISIPKSYFRLVSSGAEIRMARVLYGKEAKK